VGKIGKNTRGEVVHRGGSAGNGQRLLEALPKNHMFMREKREGKLGLCVHATGERLFGLRNGLSVQRIALPRLLTTGDGLEEITFGIDSLNGMPK
jgi:hypothetical protein